MKSLRFNFCHPFKGHARLMKLSTETPHSLSLNIDSKNSNLIEIPVNKCREGKWKIILDWEHNGRNFYYQEEFEIIK